MTHLVFMSQLKLIVSYFFSTYRQFAFHYFHLHLPPIKSHCFQSILFSLICLFLIFYCFIVCLTFLILMLLFIVISFVSIFLFIFSFKFFFCCLYVICFLPNLYFGHGNQEIERRNASIDNL